MRRLSPVQQGRRKSTVPQIRHEFTGRQVRFSQTDSCTQVPSLARACRNRLHERYHFFTVVGNAHVLPQSVKSWLQGPGRVTLSSKKSVVNMRFSCLLNPLLLRDYPFYFAFEVHPTLECLSVHHTVHFAIRTLLPCRIPGQSSVSPRTPRIVRGCRCLRRCARLCRRGSCSRFRWPGAARAFRASPRASAAAM